MTTLSRAWILAGLVLLPLLVYWPVTSFDFAGVDDRTYVAENPHVLGGLTADNAAWAFTSFEASNWHPLTWLSLMLDAEIGGPGPRAFHRTNLWLHVVNTLLVFLVLSRMTSRPWRGAFVAALFAVHPLHVESVAWITERKDVLSTAFLLLTLLAWVRYVERPGLGRYLVVVLAFALGLMAKPMLVTLPLVLVLLDFWPLRRWPAPLLEKLPLLAMALASSVVTLLAQSTAMRSLIEHPLGLRAANAVISYVWYLLKMVWPSGLAVLYPYDRDLSPLPVALAAVFLVAVSVLVTKRPWLTVGWLWYLGTLVPVIGLVQVGAEPRADRYAYVPLLGIYVALAWGLAELPRLRRPAFLAAAAGLVLVALGQAARVQTGYWRDGETLFRRALDVHADNRRAHYGLAMELARDGRTEQAIGHLREAVRLEPRDVPALVNLGTLLTRTGKLDEAVARYREALQLAPDDHDLYSNLGIALTRQGRFDEAHAAFTEALRLEPDYVLAHRGFGLLLARRGEDERAREHLERAVAASPADAGTRLNLAIVLTRLERLEQAESELREVLRLDPASAAAHKRLGMLLTRRGAWDEAVGEIEESLRLDPAQPALREDLRRLREALRSRR